MDWGPLRRAVRDATFALAPGGVDITVRPAGSSEAIAARGVWLTQDQMGGPGGADFQRAEARYAMAVRKDQVPVLPRRSRIEAPEPSGSVIRGWLVDGYLGSEPEHRRVLLVPDEDFVS